ncbi:MAG: hypothetical protein AB8H03_07625 [Saprospiraceae bacterium]
MKKLIFLFLITFSWQTCGEGIILSEPKSTDIFQCKINGIDWEPEGDGVGFSDDNLDIYYENFFLNAIQIRTKREIGSQNDFMSISFFVGNGIIGSHDILGTKLFTDYNCGNYYRDTLTENIIDIISIDSINNIIEGTFYFTAKEGSTSTCTVEEIAVTDGYFKAKYRN